MNAPRRRALVVEDSASMRQLVCYALRKIGAVDYDECANGVEALKSLRESTYDVLLIDINMPVIDGLKVLERVREDPRHSDMRICVLTTETTDRSRAMALGAHEYLVKPVRSEDVVPTILRLLRR
jgi:two-component system chemotaxis response regulator CheY